MCQSGYLLAAVKIKRKNEHFSAIKTDTLSVFQTIRRQRTATKPKHRYSHILYSNKAFLQMQKSAP